MTSDAIVVGMADAIERNDRHGNRIGAAHGPAWHPVTNPGGFRAYARLTRYSKALLQWIYNPLGQRKYLAPVQYRIYLAVVATLKAGNDLSVTGLANETGASRSHVSFTLKRLAQLRFIEIIEVVRGRAGRLVARLTQRLRQMFAPPTSTSRQRTTNGNVLERTFSAWDMSGSLSDWVRDGLRPAR